MRRLPPVLDEELVHIFRGIKDFVVIINSHFVMVYNNHHPELEGACIATSDFESAIKITKDINRMKKEKLRVLVTKVESVTGEILDVRMFPLKNGSILCLASTASHSPLDIELAKPEDKLTPTQKKIQNLIDAGLSSKEIVEKLHVSIHTVHSHRTNIHHVLHT